MMTDSDKGRIAIKFGAASSSSKPSPRSNAPSNLGKRSRHHAFGGEAGHDSESDDDRDRHGRHEAITGFGVHGAETRRRRDAAPKAYVIERQPNRDWRTEMRARRGRNLLPEEAKAQQNGPVVETEPADQDREIQWGLNVREGKTEEEMDGAGADGHQPPASSAKDDGPERRNGQPQLPPERTPDDEAMDSLLGRTPAKPRTIIPSPLTEDEAYRRDAVAAGAESTLEDYEAMPVEEFGAALLRGMGWDGEPRGPRPKNVRRRPNRLGLGAKELKEAEDLGAWGHGAAKKKRPRLDEYRREESRRKESRRHEDSYKRERERDGHGDRDRHPDRLRDRDRDRHPDRLRDRDRDRRR